MRTDGRLFSLRPRVLDLGYAYLSSTSLPEVAQPHLEDLVARVHESCSVSVLDGEDIVYVARVSTKRLMTVAISVGEQPETVEDMYEPFLIQQGMIARTPRGRVAMPAAWQHLGLPLPVDRSAMPGLFD